MIAAHLIGDAGVELIDKFTHSPVRLVSVFGAVVASMMASCPTPAWLFHVALLIVVSWKYACSIRVLLHPLRAAASRRIAGMVRCMVIVAVVA